MFDPIVESVKHKYTDRSIRGIEKYGTTLDNNVTDNFLQHLQEELMDATLYIEKQLSVKDSKLNMVKEFNDTELRRDLTTDFPIYIYFHSPGCGPCKQMKPLVEEFGENPDIIMYTVYSNQGEELQKQLNIFSYPSLVLIKNGQLKEGSVGAGEIEKMIKDGEGNK